MLKRTTLLGLILVGAVLISLPFTASAQFGITAIIPENQGTISLIDVATNTRITTLNDFNFRRELRHVAITPDSTLAYISSPFPGPRFGVVVVDLTTNKVSGFIEVPGTPWDIAISPNGRFAYVTNWCGNGTGCGNGGVFVIEIASNTVIAHIKEPLNQVYGTYNIDIGPDGDSAYVTVSTLNPFFNVFEIDLRTNAVVDAFHVGIGSEVQGVVVTREHVLITDILADSVRVIRRRTISTPNQIVATLPVGDNPVRVAVSPNGRKAYVTNRLSNTVSVINLVSLSVVDTISVGENPLAVAFSPDGVVAYVTHFCCRATMRLSVIDAATDRVTNTITIPAIDPWEVAFYRGAPVVSNISPNLAVEGSAAIQISVTGRSFTPLSEVRWNGVKRETIFVSATELRATITASDLARAGAASVTVFNPPPGGGTSNAAAFVIASRLAAVSSASFASGPVAAEAIVAAFGARLATGTQSANTLPLPTSLLGTSVQVIGANGAARQASLFFVSPGQINFQIPPGTTTGQATVRVTAGDGNVSQGVVQIVAVSLGIFTANADGRGVAAADILRVKADGSRSFERAAQLDGSGQRFIPRCIDLGPPGEQVFLILYGTGVRGIGNLSAIQATIGNMNLPVLFAGAQGTFVGLDQINLGPIPRGLIGAGAVDVILRVNNQPANTVQVCISASGAANLLINGGFDNR
jgi:uncharacterized protein (TIGR03437 family)